MTVLSLEEESLDTIRVKRTGMRTAVALGKNLASFAVGVSFCTRALAVA